MSIRIYRTVAFIVDGDGISTVLKINLKEHLESMQVVGGFSPSGAENVTLKSNRDGTFKTISSFSIQDFVLTVTLAAPLTSDTQYLYTVNAGLLFEGDV
jgi:hypothetical protein